MYKLQLGAIKETYDDLDSAMIDCFGIYPDADFSNWNSTTTETWMDIYMSCADNEIIGTIKEVE